MITRSLFVCALTLFFPLLSEEATPPCEQNITTTPVTSEPTSDKQQTEIQLRAFTDEDITYFKKALYDKNADMNALSPSGFTLLEILCFLYLKNIPTELLMQVILLRGADVNALGKSKKTALHLISYYGLFPEMFEQLQKEDKDSQTAPDKVEKETSKNSEAEDTVKNEDNDNKQNANIPLRDKQDILKTIELLLAYGANPFIGDENGITPLHLILQKKDADLINLLIEYEWLQLIAEENETTTLLSKTQALS